MWEINTVHKILNFKGIYVFLSRISKCRKSRVLVLIFWVKKLVGANFLRFCNSAIGVISTPHCLSLYRTILTLSQLFLKIFGIVWMASVIGHCSLAWLFVFADFPPIEYILNTLLPQFQTIMVEIFNFHPSCWFHSTMEWIIYMMRRYVHDIYMDSFKCVQLSI